MARSKLGTCARKNKGKKGKAFRNGVAACMRGSGGRRRRRR